MKFINLTPHEIKVIHEGFECTFPPSGTVARVAYERGPTYVLGNPEGNTDDPAWGHITFAVLRERKSDSRLPEPQEGVLYIVSRDVAQHNLDRRDLIVPDTEDAVRDDKGRIIGVPGFVAFSK